MRLRATRRDELAGLANSLNAMVEELAAAAQQRKGGARGDRGAGRVLRRDAGRRDRARGAWVLKLHIERWVPDSHVVVLNPQQRH
jgi:hypothetical protein